MNEHPPAVRLVNVNKLYESRRERSAGVHNINCEARRGELMLFVGPSGSGKTTLLTLAAGLLEPTSGVVLLFGKSIRNLPPGDMQRLRALHMGFVFQTFRLIDALTVEENVELVRRLAQGVHLPSRPDCAHLLERFGLTHLRKAFPPTLSQGEKQRLAIARALANDPELIIADEPTASLSTDDGMEVIRILYNAAASLGKCVLVATHDLRLKEFADRVVQLRDGRVVEKQEETPQSAYGFLSAEGGT
jgi:putative ABC transport system ATP-binding protein